MGHIEKLHGWWFLVIFGCQVSGVKYEHFQGTSLDQWLGCEPKYFPAIFHRSVYLSVCLSSYIHYITLHYSTLDYITYMYSKIQTYIHPYIHACMHTSHHITVHYTTLHYTTLHYLALHCSTLQYIALHWHTYIYICVYIYIYMYTRLRTHGFVWK